MNSSSALSYRLSLLACIGVGLLIGVVACDVGGPATGDPPTREDANNRTVAERIEEWGTLNDLEAALRSTGLFETLNDEGSSFTVFATRLNSTNNAKLTADQARLQSILQYHVVSGEELTVDDLSGGQTLQTLAGDELTISTTDTTTSVNGAQIETKDITGTNGYVHVVERALLENQSVSSRLELEARTSRIDSTLETNGGLSGSGPYTVFAPVNGGFGGIEYETTLLQNSDLLSNFVNYHIVDGSLKTSDLSDGQTLTTLSGNQLQVSVADDGTISINGAEVETADLGTSNGVIHHIGEALLDNQTITGRTALTSNYSNLETGLNQVGLTETLDGGGPFTVFAPQNGAYGPIDTDTLESSDALYQSVLEYHVVSGQALESGDLSDGQTLTTVDGAELQVSVDGSTVQVNGHPVQQADLQTSNGVIHGMGSVMLKNQTISDRTALTSVLNSLEDLLQQADLYGTLDDPNETFTVFAPADGAFAALNSDALTALNANRNKNLLQKILTYHAVGDQAYSSTELEEGRRLQTLQGSNVRTAAGSGGVQVNGIPVAAPDIQASNGVVHLIDEDVLLPAFDTVEQSVMSGYTELEKALTETNLRQDVKDENDITVFAPTNAAFEEYLDSAFGADSFSELTESQRDEVRQNLQYHVATEEIASGAISDGDQVPTLEGSDLNFTVDGNTITVEGATIQETNNQSTNGLLHQIDQVLVAPDNR